jgi:anti-anti-sigma regulatory factor
LKKRKCAVFKLKGETFQSIYSHFFPEFRDDDLKDFIKFLKDNFKPNVDWVSFFKVLGMNTVEFNDIKELIPDKIEYKNRILELKILPFVNDNSFLMIFKDQSESLKDFTTNENREVLSKFYSLFVKNPTLLSLFLLEINFLISKDNNQKMAYTLHSLKGLLHFIGLKKLAHDTHILEFMPDESEKRKEFDILRARIQTFLKSNKISNDLVQVDQNVLNVLNAPLDQFLSIDALVKNFDGMVRFYLDNIQSNYMVFKDDLTTFFITRNVATALISIFNHLLRNVGAHGEEQSFKVQVLLQENSEITIRMRNEYKKEQLDKIPFLSGHDIGVNIVQEISQEHDIFFKFNESEKYYENNLVFKVLDKSELVKMTEAIKEINLEAQSMKLTLSERIDENSTFDQAIKLIDAEMVKELIIYCGDLQHMNSAGIRTFIDFLKYAHENVNKVIYTHCPSLLVSQFNMVKGFFFQNSEVYSFYCPYYNPVNDEEKSILVLTTDLSDEIPPDVEDEDGNELEFDGFSEKYFQFLQKLNY